MLTENSKKIVLKLGSSTVVDNKGAFKKKWVSSLIKDIKKYGKNKDFVIVSSGAIALGQKYLRIKKKKIKLEMSQAIAAIGQIHLAGEFQKLFDKHKIKTGQILISPDDTEQRRRAINVRRTFDNLFKLNAIPIVNENDSTATAEIKYGDNDRLAARVAGMLSADCLILLSNVNGLYSKDPKKEKSYLIKEVNDLNDEIISMAGDASELGSGGMITKLEAAKICMSVGSNMVIASGNNKDPLMSIERGVNCTWFKPENSSKNSLKVWLSGQLKPSGKIFADIGASKALLDGKSLLAAGVTKANGSFDKGDTLVIFNDKNIEIARGLSNYNSEDLNKIIGKKSKEIEVILGYVDKPEIIHRNNLVYSGEQES